MLRRNVVSYSESLTLKLGTIFMTKENLFFHKNIFIKIFSQNKAKTQKKEKKENQQ